MLGKLSAAWRARRVLLTGNAGELSALLESALTALGARPMYLPPDASSETIWRALTAGRVSAVIVCAETAPQTLLCEIREAGVPLTLLCPKGSAQETALAALTLGARYFIDGDLPCGVYGVSP